MSTMQDLERLFERNEDGQTVGMSIEQRILHVGGRNNSAGYVEFGSVQAVEALVRQALRDINLNYARPAPAQAVPDGWRLVKAGALAMVVNALRRDAEEGRPVRGEMADELIAAAPEHKA